MKETTNNDWFKELFIDEAKAAILSKTNDGEAALNAYVAELDALLGGES